jgi:hypothetical protein
MSKPKKVMAVACGNHICSANINNPIPEGLPVKIECKGTNGKYAY